MVPRAPTMSSITLTLMCQILLIFLARSWYFSNFSSWLCSTLGSCGMELSPLLHFFFSRLAPAYPVCCDHFITLYHKSHKIFQSSFSMTLSMLCSNLFPLQRSKWIAFPMLSCLFLYSFLASLLHLEMMCMTLSSSFLHIQ